VLGPLAVALAWFVDRSLAPSGAPDNR